MMAFTPQQILGLTDTTTWTTQQYIRAADYIANNIEEITTLIHKAIENGNSTVELDIPGIPQ